MVWAAKTSEVKCVEHDFVWVYGFDVDKIKQRRAWRKLVDNMGADVMSKELASHCEPACGGVGLMAAKFLDGTMLNELSTKRKAPAQCGQLKKPAASASKAKPAPRVQDANFPAEEDAEEEEKAKDFEVNFVEYAEGDL